MKRKIYDWKKEIIWFLLVVSFAVLLALWGLRSVPAIMQTGLYLPDHLVKMRMKLGLVVVPTVGGKLDPNPWVKFLEMLLMQGLWFVFVSCSFRVSSQKKKETYIKRLILSASGSFAYGMLMTIVWFYTGNRMSQLTVGFILYVGASFCIWFASLTILSYVTEIVVKNTALSIGTQILRFIARIYAFLISPMWYYWFYAEGFSYDAYWVPFMTKQIVVFLALLKEFLIYAVIIAAFGAVCMIILCNILLFAKKEDVQNVDKAKSCARLIVHVAPNEILYGANISFEWLCFLMDNGNNTFRTRHMAAFLQGENLVSSLHHYVTGKIEVEKYDEKICLFWEEEGSQLTYTKVQKRKIEAYLKEMEENGFKIIINHHNWLLRKGMEKILPERLLYHEYPVRISNQNSIPFELIEEYDEQKCARKVCLEMNEFLEKEKADSFLRNSAQRLCMCEGSVAQFYNLLKMAEYCIHKRALYALIHDENIVCKGKELQEVSLGTWRKFQNHLGEQKVDDELLEYVKLLDRMAARNAKSNIKAKNFAFPELTRVIVNLRNRFVGHGTMIYSIDAKMLYPMANVVYQILKIYVQNPNEVKLDQQILSGRTEIPIKAVWKKNGDIYLFNGIDRFGYRDYLNYETGEFITIEKDGSGEIGNAPVFGCAKKARGNYVLNDGKNRKSYTEEQIIIRDKFIKKYKNSSYWNVFARSDKFDSIGKDIGNNFITMQMYQEQLEVSELHYNLMKMGIDKCVRVYDAEIWDYLIEHRDNLLPYEESLIYQVYMEGGFVPRVPIRLGLLGDSRYSFSNKFSWIKSLEMKRFNSYPMILSWASNVPVNRTRLKKFDRWKLKNQSDFKEREIVYQRILEELDCPSLLKSGSIYMGGFFKNIFDYEDAATSTMALFDFIEFALKSVQYTLMELQKEPVSDDYVNLDIRKTGKIIKEHAQKGSVLYQRVNHSSLKIPQRCQELHKQMKNYLPLEITGEEMDFESLIYILGLLRNSTKAHGVIREEHVGTLWSLLLYYAVMCAVFLDLEHFELYIAGDRKLRAGYRIGYTDGYVEVGDYFILKDHVPCLLWEYEKGRRYYINYFYGDYVVPEVVEEHSGGN